MNALEWDELSCWGTSVKNLLITGRPGIGKTTVVRGLLGGLEMSVGGFYTEEIRSGGARVGFRVIDLGGPQGLLAHADPARIGSAGRPPRVGKYRVDVEEFERVGLGALERALSASDVVVIDEIGKMELLSLRFRETVRRALDSPKTVLGVIQQRPDPFLDAIRGRPDVRLITVTLDNRDRLPSDLLAELTSGA